MNKSFKTVWNTARRCYVAVNEKVSGAAQASGKSGALVAAVVAATMVAGVAQADEPAAEDPLTTGIFNKDVTIDLSKVTAEKQQKFISVTDNATVNLTGANDAEKVKVSFNENSFAVKAGTVNIQKDAVLTLADGQTLALGVAAKPNPDGTAATVGKLVNDGTIKSTGPLTITAQEGSSAVNNNYIHVGTLNIGAKEAKTELVNSGMLKIDTALTITKDSKLVQNAGSLVTNSGVVFGAGFLTKKDDVAKKIDAKTFDGSKAVKVQFTGSELEFAEGKTQLKLLDGLEINGGDLVLEAALNDKVLESIAKNEKLKNIKISDLSKNALTATQLAELKFVDDEGKALEAEALSAAQKAGISLPDYKVKLEKALNLKDFDLAVKKLGHTEKGPQILTVTGHKLHLLNQEEAPHNNVTLVAGEPGQDKKPVVAELLVAGKSAELGTISMAENTSLIVKADKFSATLAGSKGSLKNEGITVLKGNADFKSLDNTGKLAVTQLTLSGDDKSQSKGLIVTGTVASDIAIKGDAGLMLVTDVPTDVDGLAKLNAAGLYTNKSITLSTTSITVGDAKAPAENAKPAAGSLVLGSNSVMTVVTSNALKTPFVTLSADDTLVAEPGAKVVVDGLADVAKVPDEIQFVAGAKIEAVKADKKTLVDGVQFSTLGDKFGYDYSVTPAQDVGKIALKLTQQKLSDTYADAVYMPTFVTMEGNKPKLDEKKAVVTHDFYDELDSLTKANDELQVSAKQDAVTAQKDTIKQKEDALAALNKAEQPNTEAIKTAKAELKTEQDKLPGLEKTLADAQAKVKPTADLDLIAAVISNKKASFADRTVTLNAAFAPAATAGVGFATIGAADLVTDGIYGHIDTVKASKNLWVNLLGARVNGKDDAFDFGKTTTGYKSTKYGAVVGFDMPVATGANAGVAVSYVKDKVENKGAYSAENKVNTFGITAYGRYAVTDSIKVDGQLSYLHGENKITDSVVAMDDAKVVNKAVDAKVKTNAFVASVRGGMDFAVSSFTVTPHIGLNVIYAKQGSFDTNVDGKKITNTSAKASTTVELPVGVTAKMAMDVKGWKVAPQADLSIAPIFGNRNTKYTITGVSGGTSEFEAQFAGKYAATAGLGVMAENKAGVSVGAFYNAVKTKNGLDNQMKIEIQKAF